MNGRSNLVDVEVRLLERREMSVLIRDHDGKQVFLPQSQIEIYEPEGVGALHTIAMPDWLAKEKGLI